MLGAVVATATNVDVVDLDETGRVVAKNNVAGLEVSRILTTKENGGANGMAALIVECVPATKTVVCRGVMLHLAPKVIVVRNLASLNGDDHFG
jgi:hypothetical protein